MKSPIRRRFFDESSWPFAWVFVAACLLLIAFGKQVHRITNVAISQQFDPYYYEFQYLDTGEKFNRHICRDYESPSKDFLPGKVFDEIGFIEMPDCWSLNPDSQAYYTERYDKQNGQAVYWQEKDQTEAQSQEQGQSSAAPLTH